ncbi:hypothetical protein TrRE_jg12663, partial [Triparma retinervis]
LAASPELTISLLKRYANARREWLTQHLTGGQIECDACSSVTPGCVSGMSYDLRSGSWFCPPCLSCSPPPSLHGRLWMVGDDRGRIACGSCGGEEVGGDAADVVARVKVNVDYEVLKGVLGGGKVQGKGNEWGEDYLEGHYHEEYVERTKEREEWVRRASVFTSLPPCVRTDGRGRLLPRISAGGGGGG